MDYTLKLFGSKDKPDNVVGYALYEKGIQYNNSMNFDHNVKLNENFYIGKQWEGVESNGLPTPQINIIKRVVGFIVATITTDNIRITASALANTVGTANYKSLIGVVNDEFEALVERNKIPSLVREFARNAAVDGDGCIYTYWDSEAETGQTIEGQEIKGCIRSEIIENRRVFFGNPNNNDVQSQPYIIIAMRRPVRNVRIKAKENGVLTWRSIMADYEENNTDEPYKYSDDNVTVLQLFWKDDKTGNVWSYEYTKDSSVTEPFDMGIKLYPINWLNWDYVQDCYHGQAMVTGLIPNQVFINKGWAMVMISILRSAFGKVLYDATRIKKWDNRVGSAIPIKGGDVNSVARILDPVPINPQVSQIIDLCVNQTEQSLGATSVALGDTRPDNTSAIIALQRAASTPHEMTKQNLYQSMEDLFRIYLEFMGEYYGKRYVDAPPTTMEKQAVLFAQQMNPDLEVPEEVPVLFDFDILKSHPVILKLDAGASTYYSEIASIQTLDNLLMNGHINIVDYLERIPDDYVPGRRALIEKKRRELEQQNMMAASIPSMSVGGNTGMMADQQIKPDIPTGGGYGGIQRAINQTGDTKGII